MRISDWSSDVCSSDLVLTEQRVRTRAVRGEEIEVAVIVEIDPARLARRAAGSDGGEVLADEAAAALIAEQKVGFGCLGGAGIERSEEHTSELQSLMRISYAVFCLKKKKTPEATIAYT